MGLLPLWPPPNSRIFAHHLAPLLTSSRQAVASITTSLIVGIMMFYFLPLCADFSVKSANSRMKAWHLISWPACLLTHRGVHQGASDGALNFNFSPTEWPVCIGVTNGKWKTRAGEMRSVLEDDHTCALTLAEESFKISFGGSLM